DSHNDIQAGAMNWRRGLFRLWIVGTALFVIAIAFVSYSEIKTKFDALDNWNSRPADFELFVPELCGEARGVGGLITPSSTDYRNRRTNLLGQIFSANAGTSCRNSGNSIRNIAGCQITTFVRKLYPDHGIDMPFLNPWATLGLWASIAFGIPLVVLVLGASLVWAFSGFAAKRP